MYKKKNIKTMSAYINRLPYAVVISLKMHLNEGIPEGEKGITKTEIGRVKAGSSLPRLLFITQLAKVMNEKPLNIIKDLGYTHFTMEEINQLKNGTV